MDNNKDLGKLFKERLANAEAEPSGALWSQIEKTLDHKQKRRGFLWLWLGALLLLSISALVYLNTESKNVPEHNLPLEIPASKDDMPQNTESKNDRTIAPSNDLEKDEKTSDQRARHKTNIPGGETVSAKSNTLSKRNPNVEKQLQTEKSSRRKNTTPISTSLTPSTSTAGKSTVAQRLKSEKSVLVKIMSTPEDLDSSQSNRNTEKGTIHELTHETGPKVVASNTPKNVLQKSEQSSAIDEEKLATSDSIIKKKRLPKEATQKEIVEEEPVWRNWLLSFQAGPNVFEHLNNRTPFENSLTSGQTKLDVSYSYGLLVNVPLGEKTFFRFGYKRANLKSSTTQAISNISENGAPVILTSRAITRNRNTIAPAFEQSLGNSDVFTIDQQIDYQGIPIEFLYRLRDGKINIDALVGVTAHVLGKSTVTLKNENGSFEAGSAASLKDFSIAPTIGLIFRYHVFENFSFDLEPTFQYQINAFENGYKNTYPLIISLNVGGTLKL